MKKTAIVLTVVTALTLAFLLGPAAADPASAGASPTALEGGGVRQAAGVMIDAGGVRLAAGVMIDAGGVRLAAGVMIDAGGVRLA